MEIIRYETSMKEILISIWEKSVKSTHHFLSQQDFDEIKLELNEIPFHELNTFCYRIDDKIEAFMICSETKVEALFVSPEYFGKGIGTKLMYYAVNTLKIRKVDVNEQNTNAAEFYYNLGFKKIGRQEKDDQGRDYPILQLSL